MTSKVNKLFEAIKYLGIEAQEQVFPYNTFVFSSICSAVESQKNHDNNPDSAPITSEGVFLFSTISG